MNDAPEAAVPEPVVQEAPEVRVRPVLSGSQRDAVKAVLGWFRHDKVTQRLTLGGYAGTGKTTVIAHLLHELRDYAVSVCAYTGKAASVLRRKKVPATTMHRLIYTVVDYCRKCEMRVDETCAVCQSADHVVTRYYRVPVLAAELVIVDEASMLTDRLVSDLELLAPKILYVGDHGQLEPIGNDPGLMRTPEIRLEEIHRQAQGSSIIQFAHAVRQGQSPAAWPGSDGVRVRVGLGGADMASYDAILCGYNKTRVALNRRVRSLRGYEGTPKPGERLICLQNDSELGLFNGMLVEVTEARRGASDDLLLLDFRDEEGHGYTKVPVLAAQFGREQKPKHRVPLGVGLFDFGYAMTVHKSQGSEWRKVAVLEQIARNWTATRWRYTAATRASEELDYFLSERACAD